LGGLNYKLHEFKFLAQFQPKTMEMKKYLRKELCWVISARANQVGDKLGMTAATLLGNSRQHLRTSNKFPAIQIQNEIFVKVIDVVRHIIRVFHSYEVSLMVRISEVECST
jgi:hypothetical protein